MAEPSATANGVTAYAPLYDEHDYVVDESEGTLPDELRGTLYRNGPGKLDAGGQQLGHLFDGDGMVSMFSIADGRLHYRNRYVRTRHYRKSLTSAGAPYRALGTMRPGGVLANALRFPANVANTGVVMHAGKLLALWEGGRPTQLDPDTLDTVGNMISAGSSAGWARSRRTPSGTLPPVTCSISGWPCSRFPSSSATASIRPDGCTT